jgi:hypothetical protein
MLCLARKDANGIVQQDEHCCGCSQAAWCLKCKITGKLEGGELLPTLTNDQPDCNNSLLATHAPKSGESALACQGSRLTNHIKTVRETKTPRAKAALPQVAYIHWEECENGVCLLKEQAKNTKGDWPGSGLASGRQQLA